MSPSRQNGSDEWATTWLLERKKAYDHKEEERLGKEERVD